MTLRIELEHHQHLWSAAGPPVDLSVPINPINGLPRAWYKGPATAEPVRSDGWIGSVAEGGAVNFRDITFNPHAHGTHTETREHIHDTHRPIDSPVRSQHIPFIMPAYLMDAKPTPSQGDWVVETTTLERHLSELHRLQPKAIILKCANGDVIRDWSNSNPPYLGNGFAEMLCQLSIDHLLIDLPSVDKEVDGGVLRAHYGFFGSSAQPREGATISELLRIPNGAQRGPGLLALQVAPLMHDAAPSRPLWFSASVHDKPKA